jgi:ribonuclease G
MTKEIIVNAGEMESRVAILENGRLMELHVEREPKIIGNIYKARVTKVLKGMDAAFVDIGVERNAFLSASDVVPETDDDDDNGRNRHVRGATPPINTLLKANQELLVQVVRAPMGSKGARITTRLSLPGRYLVLMLNSGTHTGVSRKIEDSRERQRLRGIAEKLPTEGYSLIVRTEAEGRTEEELQQDAAFLLEMAARITAKSERAPAPSLIHGDLTLIFRLIRDSFTREVNRLVVDSPDAYENILELVEMMSPGLKQRIFLYDEAMPIFHAYNIEPEVERLLRRKVWLPSGGHLVVDQAEALTAIDVNTGRFVGSVELAETVLTTNLQAAEEVARQLRLRDLGGIIVVDFIDMDVARHRQQVNKAFEDALKRDRAKIKVHNISPLGLVEMTRKRTGESLAGLLTEPCPYCSGIGRVQNAVSMALRIEREIAAIAHQHPEAEALLVTAHPRVVASMLGYEGEAQRDLEAYIGRPVYMRLAEEYHPNAYQITQLTLEQALAAVTPLEEGEIVEAQVVNPDPDLSLSPLLVGRGIYIVAPDLDAPVGAKVKVRITDTGTSTAMAEPLAAELRNIRTDARTLALTRPPLVPESALPAYLREERSLIPPRELPLLAPTAEAVPEAMPEPPRPIAVTRPAAARPAAARPAAVARPAVEPEEAAEGTDELARERRKRGRRRGRKNDLEDVVAAEEAMGDALAEVTHAEAGALPPAPELPPLAATEEGAEDGAVRRRRRRGGRGRRRGGATEGEAVVSAEGEGLEGEPVEAEVAPEAAAETPAPTRTRRRRGGRGRRGAGVPEGEAVVSEEGMPEGAEIEVAPEEAPAETLTPPPARARRRRGGRGRRGAAPIEGDMTLGEEGEPEGGMEPEVPAELVEVEPPVEVEEAPVEAPVEPPARRRRAPRRKAEPEAPVLEPAFEFIAPEAAANALRSMLSAIPEGEVPEEAVVEEAEAPAVEAEAPAPEPVAPAKVRKPRAPRKKAVEAPAEPVVEVPAEPTPAEPEAEAPAEPEVEAPRKRRAPTRRRKTEETTEEA